MSFCAMPYHATCIPYACRAMPMPQAHASSPCLKPTSQARTGLVPNHRPPPDPFLHTHSSRSIPASVSTISPGPRYPNPNPNPNLTVTQVLFKSMKGGLWLQSDTKGGHSYPCHAIRREATPTPAMPCCVMSCRAVPCHAMLCCAMP